MVGARKNLKKGDQSKTQNGGNVYCGHYIMGHHIFTSYISVGS